MKPAILDPAESFETASQAALPERVVGSNEQRNYCHSSAERQKRKATCRWLFNCGQTHRQIARFLGVHRTVVTYYLGPRCKL